MSRWADKIHYIAKLASWEAQREQGITARMEESMNLNLRIDNRIEQYLCRNSYNRGVLNLVRSAVRRELAQQRTVGGASIRDEVIVHHANPDSAENWARSMFTDPPLPEPDYFQWKWQPRPGGWQRKNLITNELFGPFVPASKRDDAPRKEICAMSLSPLQMFLLYSLFAHPRMSLPVHPAAQGVHHALTGLLEMEMTERADDCVSGYALTERAKVFLKAIAEMPLPVRRPAPWVMPEPKPEPAKPQTGH